MKLSDSIELKKVKVETDDKLDQVETFEWVSLGKCVIAPNTAARVTRGNDGKQYLYSYEITLKKQKSFYYTTNELIPKEGDEIHIVKADGSIDKVCTVAGFVTLRDWIKIWV